MEEGLAGSAGTLGATLRGRGSPLMIHWSCCLSGRPLSIVLHVLSLYALESSCFPCRVGEAADCFLSSPSESLPVQTLLHFSPVTLGLQTHLLSSVSGTSNWTHHDDPNLTFKIFKFLCSIAPLSSFSRFSACYPVMVGLEEGGPILFQSLLEGWGLTLNVTQRPSQSQFLWFGFRSSTILAGLGGLDSWLFLFFS